MFNVRPIFFAVRGSPTRKSGIEYTLKKLLQLNTNEEVFDALKTQTVDLNIIRIRDGLTQLYAKDTALIDKQELDEDLQHKGFLGEAMVASKAVLEEYFNDQEMMVIHRVHLEMEKAKLDLENQQCYQLVHGNEIIVIDDTDSDSDGTEPLGTNKLSITVFNTDVALDSEYIPQPNVSNDSPMEYYEGIPVQFAVDEDLVVLGPSVLDNGLVISDGQTMPQNSASVDLIPATNNSPSISATVGLIPNPANADDNLVINLDDSSSEDSMDSGVF
ncbi:unnamed protein product [Brassica oleracea]